MRRSPRAGRAQAVGGFTRFVGDGKGDVSVSPEGLDWRAEPSGHHPDGFRARERRAGAAVWEQLPVTVL